MTVNTIEDLIDEPDETFSVNLTNVTGTANLIDNQGVGTILDDDGIPLITIGDVSVNEGDTVTFTISLSNPSSAAITVVYVAVAGTALAGIDYTATSGTVTFLPGQISQSVTVNTLTDLIDEPDETFNVDLVNASNAIIADLQDVGTILDDDVNSPPVAVGDGYAMAADTPLLVTTPGILANDSDLEGDPITAILVINVANGVLVLNPDGSFSYTPNQGFSGTDSFSYMANDGVSNSNIITVTIDVAVGEVENEPPLANTDFPATVEDTAVDINIVFNDIGPDGAIDPATVLVIAPPTDGSVVVNPDGTVTYTPDPGFIGTDTFTYTVDDVEGLTSNVATVTVSVTPIPIGADLSLEKTVDNATPSEGDTIIYTITLTSNGPGDATGVEITALLPPGLTYVTDNSGGAYDSDTGIWNVGSLPSGALAILEITVTVDTGTAGTTITNTAAVTDSDQPDPDNINNSAGIDISINILVPEEIVGGGGVVVNPGEGRVIISEIAWMGTAADSRDEWIELRNLGTTPVDLTGWTLRWQRRHPIAEEDYRWKVVDLSGMMMPAAISAHDLAARDPIPSIEFIRRETDHLSWRAIWEPEEEDGSYFTLQRWHDETVSDVGADLLFDTTPPYEMDFSDYGDVIALLNDLGEVVDTANAFASRPGDGWPAGDARTFATMERTDPLGPDTAENWHTNQGIITHGHGAEGRPLAATAGGLNSKTLDEIALTAEPPPTRIRAGARLEIGLNLSREDRRAFGWPWIWITRPAIDEAAGGGGMIAPGAARLSFAGRHVNDLHWLRIDTSGVPPGRHYIWVVYGEGKAILIPLLVLP